MSGAAHIPKRGDFVRAFVIVLVAAFSLAGCFPPYTTHPVGTTIGFSNDPVLTGTWRAEATSADDGGKFQYYHFLPATNGSILVVVVPSIGGSSELALARLTTVRVGADHIMNLRLIAGPDSDASGQPPGTVPLLYRLDAKGRLLFFTPDEGAVKDAIKARKIAGKLGKNGTDAIVITSSGAALDKFFLSSAGLALFSVQQVTLTKLN